MRRRCEDAFACFWEVRARWARERREEAWAGAVKEMEAQGVKIVSEEGEDNGHFLVGIVALL